MSGPPSVLLLHSFGSAGRSWSAVQDDLDFKSHAPDLPGFGDAPPLPAPSIAAYADWVLAEMRAIGGEVVLVGASMGGKIAMAAAERRPETLRALILCAPSPPTPEPMEPDERARQLDAWGEQEEARRSVGRSTLASSNGPVFKLAVDDWRRTAPGAWAWWWSEGSRETIDVSGVAPGALVLAGEQDNNLGPDLQRKVTAPLLGHAEVRAVPGSRHLLALDASRAVARAITQACAAT